MAEANYRMGASAGPREQFLAVHIRACHSQALPLRDYAKANGVSLSALSIASVTGRLSSERAVVWRTEAVADP